MKNLDFLIIGAQKCATTTLFEHLRSHPDIAMPLEKEVPFFTREDTSATHWDSFVTANFKDRDHAKLWGKASPQYMNDPNIAQRIHALMPQVKLVAILRDPLDRTRSHFLMGQRRATENREFCSAIEPLLTPTAVENNRRLPAPEHKAGYESEADFYISWSEYGRILEGYYQIFDPSQILVLYTEDLQSAPEATLDKLLAFIGLPAGYRPETLGKVIHKGGSGNRIPHGVRLWLKERKALYWLWQQVPERRKGRIRFQYEQWNTVSKKQNETVPSATALALRQHYANDLQTLLTLPVDLPPWIDRYLPAGH